jgi:hypothetical protein
MNAMSQPKNRWIARALVGFALGVIVCLAYWLTGGVPRETWFNPQGTDEFIKSKTWLWPSAVLDVVFREMQPSVAAATLYALNGLTYMAISLGLLVLRDRRVPYVLFAVAVLGVLAWFNAAVMQSFSWLWLIVVAAGLGAIGYWDLRSSRRP